MALLREGGDARRVVRHEDHTSREPPSVVPIELAVATTEQTPSTDSPVAAPVLESASATTPAASSLASSLNEARALLVAASVPVPESTPAAAIASASPPSKPATPSPPPSPEEEPSEAVVVPSPAPSAFSALPALAQSPSAAPAPPSTLPAQVGVAAVVPNTSPAAAHAVEEHRHSTESPAPESKGDPALSASDTKEDMSHRITTALIRNGSRNRAASPVRRNSSPVRRPASSAQGTALPALNAAAHAPSPSGPYPRSEPIYQRTAWQPVVIALALALAWPLLLHACGYFSVSADDVADSLMKKEKFVLKIRALVKTLLQEQLEELHQWRANIERRLDDTTAEIMKVSGSLTKVIDRVGSLARTVTDLQGFVGDLDKRVSRTAQDLAMAVQEAEKLTTRVDKVAVQLGNMNADVQKLDTRVTVVANNVAGTEALLVKLHEEVRVLVADIRALSEQVKNFQEQPDLAERLQKLENAVVANYERLRKAILSLSKPFGLF